LLPKFGHPLFFIGCFLLGFPNFFDVLEVGGVPCLEGREGGREGGEG